MIARTNTHNKVDSIARKVLQRVLDPDSNCVYTGITEIGITDVLFSISPRGEHYVFDANPFTRIDAEKRYSNYHCHFVDKKPGNGLSTTTENYTRKEIIGKPSMWQWRPKMVREVVSQVDVVTDTLDHLLPENYSPSCIVLNTAPLLAVLTGAEKILEVHKPHILIKVGLGNDFDFNAKRIYDFLNMNDLRLSSPRRWLENKPSFTLSQFTDCCDRHGSYIVVYP